MEQVLPGADEDDWDSDPIVEAAGTRGPGPSAEVYTTGVAVAEASLPAGFGGALPWDGATTAVAG